VSALKSHFRLPEFLDFLCDAPRTCLHRMEGFGAYMALHRSRFIQRRRSRGTPKIPFFCPREIVSRISWDVCMICMSDVLVIREVVLRYTITQSFAKSQMARFKVLLKKSLTRQANQILKTAPPNHEFRNLKFASS
jgi:hypothetical protein